MLNGIQLLKSKKYCGIHLVFFKGRCILLIVFLKYQESLKINKLNHQFKKTEVKLETKCKELKERK